MPWIPDTAQDLRYAARQFGRERRLAAVIVLTLALGVGVNTAVFSIIDGFHRPLPVRDPERVVVLAADVKGDERGVRYKHSYAALGDLRQASSPLSDLFAFSLDTTGITIGATASPFLYSAVTGNYFTALGVTPALGRLFAPGEGEHTGDDAVVVLGHGFWQRRFGADPNVIGTSVRIGGRAARIVGVAPADFHGTYSVLDVDGYLPLNAVAADGAAREALFTDRKSRWLTILGRLQPGATPGEAQAAMQVAARRLERQYPDSDQGIGIRVIPEQRARPDPVGLLGNAGRADRAGEILLLSLAGLVLLLACFNVANLVLVRSMARTREMAVRAALGSGRGRLVRQVFTEMLLLSTLGAAAGVLLGMVASEAFERTLDLANDLPVVFDFGFDWSVFVYATAAALVSGGVIAIWPAISASRANAAEALHDGGRGDSGGRSRGRLRGMLAAAQIAGSLVLLVVAALFVRDLRGAARMDLGFTPDHLLNVNMDPSWAGYDAPRTDSFYKEVRRRVESLPGVERASLAFSIPMGYYWQGAEVKIGSRADPADEQPPLVPVNYVDERYFATMEMRIVRGRDFTSADAPGSTPVAIVNQVMAERYWPGGDAVGRQFRMRAPGWITLQIVGVAHNSRYVNLFEAPQPYIYLPIAQFPRSFRVLHVRSTLEPELLATRVRQTIADVGPEVPVADVRTMRASLEGFGGLMLLRMAARQAAALGALGLLLAVIGVYGVAAQATAQRTREIGIRMALGAASRDVLRLVLGQSAWIVAGGIIAGLLAAAAAAGALGRALRMERPFDAIVFGGVAFGLCVIAMAACYLPARRATRVLPTTALRTE